MVMVSAGKLKENKLRIKNKVITDKLKDLDIFFLLVII
jgi:hypothetical protein